jgi:hypothetical protein
MGRVKKKGIIEGLTVQWTAVANAHVQLNGKATWWC